MGGLAVANQVARRAPDIEVRLADSHGDHLYQPDLPRVPFRGDRIRPAARLDSLVRRGVQLTVDRAAGVDAGRRIVHFESGLRLSYDVLVLATGSRMDHSTVPGSREASHNFHCRRSAHRLGEALAAFRRGRIVVASASPFHRFPLASAEFALLLHDSLRRRGLRGAADIECLFPLPDESRDPSAAAPVRALLKEGGIGLRTGFAPAWVDPSRKLLHSRSGDSASFDLLVLIPPHIPQPFLASSGLLREGWVPADPETLKAGPGIYALGDTASLAAPKLGSAARVQAAVVARNAIAELEERDPEARYDGSAFCMLSTALRRAALARFKREAPPRLGRPGLLPHLAKEAFGRLYFSLVRPR